MPILFLTFKPIEVIAQEFVILKVVALPSFDYNVTPPQKGDKSVQSTLTTIVFFGGAPYYYKKAAALSS